jgi:hypothetical protein
MKSATKRKILVPWLLGVNVAVAVRERVEKTGAGVGGGRTLRSSARQGSALRCDERAKYARP